MNRRTFISAACLAPLVFVLGPLPPKPSPPNKWRVTVELRVDGLVREIRHTDFRTEKEANALVWDRIEIPPIGQRKKITITKL